MSISADSPATSPPGVLHESGNAWLSAHVFFRGRIYDEPCDQIILEVVRPFVETCEARGWIRGFFFIRYGELGSHVRLRLYGDPTILAEEVAPALQEHVHEMLPGDLAASPQEEPAAVTLPSAVPSLRWIPYEPEVERYGGPIAIRAAEQLFWCSSRVCIELLGRSSVVDREVRLGRALPTLPTLLGVFTDNPAEAASLALLHRDSFVGHPTLGRGPDYRETFNAGFQRQASTLCEHVHAFWTAVQERDALPPPLDGYHDGLKAVRERLGTILEAGQLHARGGVVSTWGEARRALLPSYGHMTNNRLGITPWEEGYLMHMVNRALSGGNGL